jgi:hypothetical protein
MVGHKGRGKFAMYGKHFVVDVQSDQDVIENAVVLDDFLESRSDTDVDLTSYAIEFARSALSTLGGKGFPSAKGFPEEEVRRHAVAAVMDRLGVEGIRAAYKDPSLHDSLVEGGFIRKSDAGAEVLVHHGVVVDSKTRTEWTVAPPPVVYNNPNCEGELTSDGAFKILNSSLRGRNCSTLNSTDVDKAISAFTRITPPTEKNGKCLLLELLMRKNNVLKRPGR